MLQGVSAPVSPRCLEEQSPAEPVPLSQDDPLHFQKMPPFPAAPLHVAAVFCPSPNQGGMFSPPESAPRGAACPRVQVHVRESRGPPIPTGLQPPADLQNCTKPWVAGASVLAEETGGPGPRGQVGSGHLRSLQAWAGASSLPRRARVQPRPLVSPCPLALHP